MCSKYVDHYRINSQHDWGEGGVFNEREDLHFDIEQDIHMSSKNCEAND
jgi:hypothetical protein